MSTNNILHRHWLSKHMLYISSICFLVICICIGFVFMWNRPMYLFNKEYVLDNNLWANLGDFIGGVIGSFLTFIGVIITCLIFKEQKEQTAKINTEQQNLTTRAIEEEVAQSKIQRFNALFFELLNLHRQQVEALQNTMLVCNNENMSYSASTNYFKRLYEELHKDFNVITKSYSKRNTAVIRKYLSIYFANANSLAPYFRVLYRIFDLIEKAEIPNKEKFRYAKIIRAQLTEEELLVIRYNACTGYGKMFVYYINKYRLFKHLPVLSLPEFSNITGLLSKSDAIHRYSLNLIFFTIYKKIYNISVGNSPRKHSSEIIFKTERYKLELNMAKESRISIILTINTLKPNRTPLMKCFRNFKEKDFAYLLDISLKEFLFYFNFSQYHNSKSVSIQGRILHSGAEVKYIYFANTNDGKRIRVSHPDRDAFYQI